MTSMYCVKCRAKKEVSETTKKVAKNGKPMLQSKCPDCSTGMTKFVAA
ncbi:MAG: hypothetical protein HYW86_01830 [Candidatus Roizmanbacteria bacterium]|nr:MAG: hypothetical protein HYW86_01830 [Candidatus Roizmanbacteria bacterium]